MENVIFHIERLDAVCKVAFYLLLVTGIRVDDIPISSGCAKRAAEFSIWIVLIFFRFNFCILNSERIGAYYLFFNDNFFNHWFCYRSRSECSLKGIYCRGSACWLNRLFKKWILY